MFKSAKPLFMLCETPLHAGSGNELGVIDLPIQRERHTGFPKVEASGIKGCIRNSFENLKEDTINGASTQSKETIINLLFGPENGNEHGSALSFTDGRLLLFPVKSIKGVFAWITCPRVLEKFRNELRFGGLQIPDALKELPREKSATEQSNLFVKGNKIVLEEYTLDIKKSEQCSKLAEWISENILPQDGMYGYLRNKMQQDIVVLSDDEFRDFVTLSTEVITRIKIDNEKGTVKNGALFSEEYLPAESILYSMVCASPIFSQNEEHQKLFENDERVMEVFQANMPEAIQLGGNATIGKGLVRVVKYNEK